MNRVVLCRHGQTLENKLGILQGKKDTVLTDVGISQARLLGYQLSAYYDFDSVYSSPLIRAKQTTEYIRESIGQLTVVYDDRLKEIDIGVYEGMHKSQVPIEKMDYAPGGETIEEVFARVKGFVDEVSDNHNGDNILIVAHNVIVKTIESYLEHGQYVPLSRNSHVKNCSFREVSF